MSTKSTIFLTNDNEHFYQELNDPHYKDGKWIGDTLVLEISQKNITIITNDDYDLVIKFNNPESEIYKELIKLNTLNYE